MLGNKLRELRARRAAGETGFTLVELLVVVVIIVALAAIAVPIFLNQKDKADNAARTSDVAAAAKFIAAGIADGSLNTTSSASPGLTGQQAITGTLYSSSGSFTVPAGMTGAWNGAVFCLQSAKSGQPTYIAANNSAGVVTTGTCATTTGVYTPPAP